MEKYTKYFTAKALSRKPSPIRALQELLSRPGTISLGGGLPNANTFPIGGLSLTLADGRTLPIKQVEQALQYSSTKGLPALTSRLSELQDGIHGKKHDSSILLSTGSQDALTKTFELLLEPGTDSLLLEEFTYSGSLAFLKPWGCHLEPVAVDKDGLVVSDLERILTEWGGCERTNVRRKPKVLYTIPTGSNPTGVSLSLARRKELLRVAKEHDLLVIEDDPYYYLQFCDSSNALPSLYSLDQDARVVRFDSLSKILSSGLRLGFMTGPSQVVDQVELHMQATCLHTSGISQAVAATLFDDWAENNGQDAVKGFQKHAKSVVEFYATQRKDFLDSAERHLSGLCKWDTPSAGFFVWLELLPGSDGQPRSSAAIAKRLVHDMGVLVVAGFNFHPQEQDGPFMRCSFSTSSKAQMDDALQRLATLLKE